MGAEEKFIIPLKGLIVRDPRSKNILPECGAIKPWIGPEGRYWRRQVAVGSCKMLEEAPKQKTVKEVVQGETSFSQKKFNGEKEVK